MVRHIPATTSHPGLPDILGPGLSVVFCGLNPGMRSAAIGHSFANRTNRFWPVLHLAGFTPHRIEPEDDRSLLDYGLGLTTAIERPTVGASELSRQEFIDGGRSLLQKIETYQPRVLAFLGKPGYAAISGRRDIAWGDQHAHFGGARVWVLPNPSGLNRAFKMDALVIAYAALHAEIS